MKLGSEGDWRDTCQFEILNFFKFVKKRPGNSLRLPMHFLNFIH
jgi:hypothetical protein